MTPGGLKPRAARRLVDQVAVDAAVAILEGVDVDEPERQDGGGQHGIELPRRGPLEGDQAGGERWQIFRLGADVGRDRLLRLTIPVADEAAGAAQAELYEAGIADHDALQAAQFVEVERLPAGLADGLTPALHAIRGGALTLDGIARPRIVEQQESRGARQQVAWQRRGGGAGAGTAGPARDSAPGARYGTPTGRSRACRGGCS